MKEVGEHRRGDGKGPMQRWVNAENGVQTLRKGDHCGGV